MDHDCLTESEVLVLINKALTEYDLRLEKRQRERHNENVSLNRANQQAIHRIEIALGTNKGVWTFVKELAPWIVAAMAIAKEFFK